MAKRDVDLTTARGALLWARAAWARTREPRLADLVDVLSARALADAPRPALTASRKRADLEAWKKTEARGDALDFPALVAAARGGSQDDVLRQVRALAAWNDPRLGAGLIALLEDPPYAGVKSRGMLEGVFAAMEATRDLRLAARARELAGRYLGIVNSGTGGWVVERLGALATALEAVKAKPLSAAEAQTCAALEQTWQVELASRRAAGVEATKAKGSISALFDAVYAAPDDDAPRLVLADALLEQGDERGELIQLQIARARGGLTPAQADREDELLTADRLAQWGQPLSNGGRCHFERGFPSTVTCYKTVRRVAGERAWATVVAVEGLSEVPQKDALHLLDQPVMEGVRTVRRLSAKVMNALAARPRRWTKVELGAVQELDPRPSMRSPRSRCWGSSSGGPRRPRCSTDWRGSSGSSSSPSSSGSRRRRCGSRRAWSGSSCGASRSHCRQGSPTGSGVWPARGSAARRCPRARWRARRGSGGSR
jgi:uncharacterized protein (TIGR02996 family)